MKRALLRLPGVALDVRIAKEFDELPPLEVLIEEGRLRVVACGAEDDFKIEARTFYVRLEAKASTKR